MSCSVRSCFLSLLRTAIGSEDSNLAACSEIAWEEVFRLAEQHHILPMIADAAHRIYGDDMPWDGLEPYKKRAKRLIFLQTMKTERFLLLYRFLSGQGLTPILMKGLICRELYSNPDYRFSADEDLLIPPEKAREYHDVLLAYGLKADSPDEQAVTAQETSYKSADGVLFLEVHRFLFPPDSDAYGKYNEFFADIFDRAVTETINGVEIRTMAPTEHLLYLICHAVKHFLHGGCGIRQVCDIGLFASKFADRISWEQLAEQIDSIRAKDYTAAIFTIAERFLGIDLTGVPEGLRSSETDPEALLDDILDSGVYGSSTMSRKHSAAMTLHAAENAGSGTPDRKHSVLRTLFPSVSSLSKRYPYLNKHPWLLPAAWMQRFFQYIKERSASNTPGDALRIGHERVSLMKKYGLLSEQPVKQVDTDEYLSAMCGLIEEGHEVSIPVIGSSMTGSGLCQSSLAQDPPRRCRALPA